ncbi:unnamed protein product, partial [Symbiodinium sp. CCMP2456]
MKKSAQKFCHGWLAKRHLRIIDSWGWKIQALEEGPWSKIFGCVKIPMPKDDDCLLHCVVQGLRRIYQSDKTKSVLEMRAELVAHLRRNKSQYIKQCGKKAKSFAEYLDVITNTGKWLAVLEMEAFARMYGMRPICFPFPLSTELSPFVVHNKQEKNAIAFRFTGSHFDLLVPSDESKPLPKCLTEIADGPPALPVRAGGSERTSQICGSDRAYGMDQPDA